jgi:hypothetical protein
MAEESTVLKKDKPLSVTEIAHGLVGGDRRGDYGHPLDDFCRTAVMWSAILKVKVTFKEVALCMISLKQSREVNKEKQDNSIDGCGYFECLDMCYAERNRRLAEGWTFDEFTGVWTKPNAAFDLAKILRDSQPQAPVMPWVPYTHDPVGGWPPVLPAYPYIGDPLPGQAPQIYGANSEVKPNG